MSEEGTSARDWTLLTGLQLGRCAEYLVKIEFMRHGFEVYTPEVDDRGIDFVARRPDGDFFEVQVKSIRGGGYVFMSKHAFPLTERRVLALVVFRPAQEPELYLLPARLWSAPNALLVSRDYSPELKSKPEWGVNISAKNHHLLNAHRFSHVVGALGTPPPGPPAA